ncbi:MAG: molybdopterin cofactor-binding domain-containing protein [Rhodospirillaceae bacterium]
MSTLPASVSRRDFLKTGGALIVSFTLSSQAWSAATEAQNVGKEPIKAPQLPGSLKKATMLDAWIRIGADNSITVFTGKAELGQGIKTALIQVAAEELVVDPKRIALVTADTGRTANEGYTAGSHSMQDSGTAIYNAAAQVRAILMQLAATRLNVPVDTLSVQDGTIKSADGRTLKYGELVTEQTLHVEAQAKSPLKDPRTHAVMGKSLPRIDIPGKVTGGVSYVHDLRLPGMVHARVVRPPSYGAKLKQVDTASVEKMPGVLKVVRNGSYLAVIAEREYQAVKALQALRRTAQWEEGASLPPPQALHQHLRSLPTQDFVDLGNAATPAPKGNVVSATYTRPYQMHASIGPSCAVALYRDDMLTVWSHTQGVYPLRSAIAELVRLPPERVRCIHMEGSGCYGHNAADDAGGDAGLLAVAFPNRPVRVQWMREDEHGWEPYGCAMVTTAQAELDANGGIAAWHYEVWSNTHSMRPGPAGNLVAGWHVDPPFLPQEPKNMPLPDGGGDRNAVPLYALPNAVVLNHFIAQMPLRVSALRSLGAYMNVFSLESFMDELARAARADPVAFRMRHLQDARAREVVVRAADKFGWTRYPRQQGRGRGFGFARYKNSAAYAAVACEVEVDRSSGRVHPLRVVAAVDSGEAVNPDGIRNQIEGGIVQSLSWTMYESVAFDRTRITSRDWSGYPIVRFTNVPDNVEVHIIDRPGMPFLGTGEAAQGPSAAALANAVADATGVRIRDLPLTSARVRAAVGV